MRSPALSLTACLIALCLGVIANAWWAAGHLAVDDAALKSLPQDVPAFFRTGGETIKSYANDPDLYRDRDLPALRNAKGPEHFFDLELLKGNPTPETRGDFIVLCNKLHVHPYAVGTLPYAILENCEKLTYAFAEYRQAPNDKAVRAKILYIAGILSHYTADAVQPLHCTVDYDGRRNIDGSSPKTGIHSKVDALPGRVILSAESIAPAKVTALDNTFARAMEVIQQSNKEVDTVYNLEDKLPPADGPLPQPIDPAVTHFTLERVQTAAEFTAALWLTAWKNSEKIELPEHHPLETK